MHSGVTLVCPDQRHCVRPFRIVSRIGPKPYRLITGGTTGGHQCSACVHHQRTASSSERDLRRSVADRVQLCPGPASRARTI
jgi:hypothetical protein